MSAARRFDYLPPNYDSTIPAALESFYQLVLKTMAELTTQGRGTRKDGIAALVAKTGLSSRTIERGLARLQVAIRVKVIPKVKNDRRKGGQRGLEKIENCRKSEAE